MKWEQYLNVMERHAIKTDDMATEDTYFMATHMPFSELEVYLGGRTASNPQLMNEEEIFENLICNSENEHRMIIVRGDNGTGKSHLIRFLKARLEGSSSTIYNPQNEQMVFLRRLNNSVRGAFSQLIEQNCIANPEVEEKLRKFVDSSDSKDESSFKTDILYSYIAAVSNDQAGAPYKPVICRDIASYLSDSRVKEHLLREGGAISRCYHVITAPSNQVLKETAIFTEEDFNVSKIIRAVIRQGDPQASDFASTLKSDDSEITKLVGYLNHFTREVVQRCADISSESTKSVFVQLRKDLKQQGKNLTLFIEDFTGFTGIDSELITVLSTEHGGDYADLCRVTSVIGITNDYYDQFRDNFTDRVTHQINVTARSFGTESFLVEMAGRYLNAIYCDPETLHQWNDNGADINKLPISDFHPPCEWESINIGNSKATLYPFNTSALLKLYESLPVKSPRMFLKEVIRAQLKEYFDWKLYGDTSGFPLNPGAIQMKKAQHGSAIDRLEEFSPEDRNRLKSTFAIWGDGTASGLKSHSGEITFGGLPQRFLHDIGFENFNGIGDIVMESAKDLISDTNTSSNVPIPDTSNAETTQKSVPVKIDAATKEYIRCKDDISGWYSNGSDLKYHADYRKWMQLFLLGDRQTCGAIPWQDLGVPAYIAANRLSDMGVFYIEGQDSGDEKSSLVYVERSAESRDALFALLEAHYAGGWDFEGSVYYQQKLITWMERHKNKIISNVMAAETYESRLPILKWCLSLSYLKALILGIPLDMSSNISIAASLLSPINGDNKFTRETQEWNDLVSYVNGKKSDFEAALKLLRQSTSTVMGAVQSQREKDTGNSSFYRSEELFTAIDELQNENWNLKDTLTDIPEKHMLYNPAALLGNLYPRVQKVTDAEKVQYSEIITKLEDITGGLSVGTLTAVLSKIQEFFSTLSMNGVIGYSELRSKYEAPPKQNADKIVSLINTIDLDVPYNSVQYLAKFSGNALHELSDYLRDFQRIAQAADKEGAKAKETLKSMSNSGVSDELTKNVLDLLNNIYTHLESMEATYVD